MQGNLAPKLIRQDLATLSYPEQHEVRNGNDANKNLKFDRWSACMNKDKSQLFVMFSNYKFAWIYRYNFEKDGSLKEEDGPSVVTQSNARAIYFLNDAQLVIQTNRGLCVYNLATKKVDWSIFYFQ